MGSVASGAGLEIDRVEDTVLATGEAFGMLAAFSDANSISCEAVVEGDGIDVAISVHPHPDAFPDPSWETSLGRRVLAIAADDVEYSPGDAAIRFRISGAGEE